MKTISLLQVIVAFFLLILIIGSKCLYNGATNNYSSRQVIELKEKLGFSSKQLKYIEAIEHLSRSRDKMLSAYFSVSLTMSLVTMVSGLFLYKKLNRDAHSLKARNEYDATNSDYQ